MRQRLIASGPYFLLSRRMERRFQRNEHKQAFLVAGGSVPSLICPSRNSASVRGQPCFPFRHARLSCCAFLWARFCLCGLQLGATICSNVGRSCNRLSRSLSQRVLDSTRLIALALHLGPQGLATNERCSARTLSRLFSAQSGPRTTHARRIISGRRHPPASAASTMPAHASASDPASW